MSIVLHPIGTIHSPYIKGMMTPEQPVISATGEFWISLKPEYVEGLSQLASFRYITLIFHLDQATEQPLVVSPPIAPELKVGIFASRSPLRPNHIGMSVVALKGIEGSEILISGVDVYNGTPLLDIKPYIKSYDAKSDANDGWLDQLPDKDHQMAHLLGLDHDHDHSHSHDGHGHHHGTQHQHDGHHSKGHHRHGLHIDLHGEKHEDHKHKCQCNEQKDHGHDHKHEHKHHEHKHHEPGHKCRCKEEKHHEHDHKHHDHGHKHHCKGHKHHNDEHPHGSHEHDHPHHEAEVHHHKHD